jgi:hypothetical protein
MILPTKRIDADRALLVVGGDILAALGRKTTISSVWHAVQGARAQRGNASVLTFDWFVLALVFLNSVGVVELSGGQLRRAKR